MSMCQYLTNGPFPPLLPKFQFVLLQRSWRPTRRTRLVRRAWCPSRTPGTKRRGSPLKSGTVEFAANVVRASNPRACSGSSSSSYSSTRASWPRSIIANQPGWMTSRRSPTSFLWCYSHLKCSSRCTVSAFRFVFVYFLNQSALN